MTPPDPTHPEADEPDRRSAPTVPEGAPAAEAEAAGGDQAWEAIADASDDPRDRPGEPGRLEEALAAAADGDEQAWAWIVESYSRRVFGLLYAQCGEAETSEELVQSTFCTVVAKIGDYTERGRFEAWLFRIAMNRLRDEMRRRRRHAVPVEHEALSGMVGGDDPEGPPTDEIGLLRNAMADLSDADRRVLHLRHAAGLGFKQIAEVLEQPLGTVLARHHRALRKLRGELEERLGEGGDE